MSGYRRCRLTQSRGCSLISAIKGSFTGRTKDWPTAYPDIVAAADANDWAWIIKMGRGLFNLAGHGSIRDAGISEQDAEDHFKKKLSWHQELLLLKQKFIKKCIDSRSDHWTTLEAKDKQDLQDYIVLQQFREDQKRALRSLKAYLTSAAAKKGERGSELTALLSSTTTTEIINGEFDTIKPEYMAKVWHAPAVVKFADLLELLEGKGRTGSGSFWSSMQEPIRHVHPERKGPKVTYTEADSELKDIWAILVKQYSDDVQGLAMLA